MVRTYLKKEVRDINSLKLELESLAGAFDADDDDH